MKFNLSLFNFISSKTKVKIIRFLLDHEAFMSEREIASVLNVSHMSVNRTMRELADTNLVDFVKIGKAHLWRVNRKSYAYKVLSEIIKGISSIKEPLEDLKKTIMKNLPRTSIKKMILFGSITKGTESASSDIDIFILVRDIKNKEKIEPSIEKLSDICFEKYGNNLAPYVLTENEMKQKKNLKIISEINRGIQIFPEN